MLSSPQISLFWLPEASCRRKCPAWSTRMQGSERLVIWTLLRISVTSMGSSPVSTTRVFSLLTPVTS